jgi:hypothetical protein
MRISLNFCISSTSPPAPPEINPLELSPPELSPPPPRECVGDVERFEPKPKSVDEEVVDGEERARWDCMW